MHGCGVDYYIVERAKIQLMSYSICFSIARLHLAFRYLYGFLLRDKFGLKKTGTIFLMKANGSLFFPLRKKADFDSFHLFYELSFGKHQTININRAIQTQNGLYPSLRPRFGRQRSCVG